LVLVVLLVGVSDVQAQHSWRPGDNGSARVRFGLFDPEADSKYWDDKFLDFTGQASDFKDPSFGLDYIWQTGSSSAVMFGFGWWEGGSTQAYRDWVDGQGHDIAHTTTVSVWELTASWMLQFGRRGMRPTPYVGVGGGFLWYTLEEAGAFIDFSELDYPIVNALYSASGTTFVYFALAGIDVPITHSFSFVAEGRWKEAADDLEGDFAGFGELDLSGVEISGGFAWNF
jgi:hypothetical protein